MPKKKTGISRREALTVASAAAVGSLVPSWAGAASRAEAVTVPKSAGSAGPSWRTGYSRFIGNQMGWLPQMRQRYAQGAKVYLKTGDVGALNDARHVAYQRIGHLVHYQPETASDRAILREAHAFLEQIEEEFAEVPWGRPMKEGLEKYRAWGRAGGQLSYRRLASRLKSLGRTEANA